MIEGVNEREGVKERMCKGQLTSKQRHLPSGVPGILSYLPRLLQLPMSGAADVVPVELVVGPNVLLLAHLEEAVVARLPLGQLLGVLLVDLEHGVADGFVELAVGAAVGAELVAQGLGHALHLLAFGGREAAVLGLVVRVEFSEEGVVEVGFAAAVAAAVGRGCLVFCSAHGAVAKGAAGRRREGALPY